MSVNRLLSLPFAMMIACIVSAATSSRSLASSDPTDAAAACLGSGAGTDVGEFSRCCIVNMMSDDQRRVAQCIALNRGLGGAAFCMAGMQLLPLGLQIAGCAQRNKGDMCAIATCVGRPPALPPEGQRLAACVAANSQNFWGAALCAGGRELTPEQTVFANCAVAAGMQPHGMVVCVSGQLTMNELQKCLTLGMERDGCFGANNAVTRLVCDAWQGVAGGAHSVLDQPDQIFGGVNSVFNKPASWRPVRIRSSTIRDRSPAVAIRLLASPTASWVGRIPSSTRTWGPTSSQAEGPAATAARRP